MPNKGDLNALKVAENTTNEIFHQPSVWRKVYSDILEKRSEIDWFLKLVRAEASNIILTGAGTSAYIGLSVQGVFRKSFKIACEPISTTSIVTHPQDYFVKDRPLLMVSFARSGNSPESCAAVDLANQYTDRVFHLIITCNEGGKLAVENKGKKNTFVFVLPAEANDKSLAMTSSFTGMLLAASLMARLDDIDALGHQVEALCHYTQVTFDQKEYIQSIASKNFNRAVFLGSGALYGIAKEAQLKMQELTDGIVVGKYDSFLGLRHGPKAVIDDKTLVVYHLSNRTHAKKYELDLITNMKKNSTPLGVLSIGQRVPCKECVDWSITFDDDIPLEEELLAVASMVPAQLLALYKSTNLGLSPDNPSRNGAISRVVQGVSIYKE